MKKVFHWIGCITAPFLVLALIIGGIIAYCLRDNIIAGHPSWIAWEADFDLPDYEIVSQGDNMDRGTSAWSCCSYHLRLKEKMSDKYLEKLAKLVENDKRWVYNAVDNAYIFNTEDDENSERNITIRVEPKTNTVNLYFEWWDILS